MKKLLLLIVGMLVLSGTAMADCGSCAGDAKKKAKCELKTSQEKVECDAKAAKKKACKKLEAAKQCGENCKKQCGALKESKDKASEKAQ